MGEMPHCGDLSRQEYVFIVSPISLSHNGSLVDPWPSFTFISWHLYDRWLADVC